MQVNFYEGPPFKYKAEAALHTNFVNCVRYSPNGNFFFSVSNGASRLVSSFAAPPEQLGMRRDAPDHAGGAPNRVLPRPLPCRSH